MEARTVSKGLAWFSLGIGIAELAAGKRIGRALGAEDRSGVIRGFGAREVIAGLGLLQAPAHSTRVWNRVAGDALDLAALGALLRGGNPKARWVWGAIGAVAGVTIADVLTARALGKVPDVRRGKSGPVIPSRTKPMTPVKGVVFEADFNVPQSNGDDGGTVFFQADPALDGGTDRTS